VWKSVEYGVSNGLDTAYWGFLGVGTTFDIFQNIILYPYLEYGVLSLSRYGVMNFIPFVVFGKHVEESKNTPSPTPIRSPRIHSTFISSNIEKLQELTVTDPEPSSSTPSLSSPKPSYSIKPSYSLQPKTRRFKWYKSFFEHIKGRYGYLFGYLKTAFMPCKSFHALANHIQEVMQESLPFMVDSRVKEVTNTTVPVYVAYRLILERQKMQAEVAQIVDSSVRSYMSNHVLHVHPTQASKASTQEQQYQLYLTMKDDLQLQQADLPIWLALKIKFQGLLVANTSQKISEHETYVIGESSSGQAKESDPSPSTSGNQEQLDDFDFWTDKYATDDDELPTEKVSQELVEEMSETVDEAKLRKVVDEMLRQRCTLKDEHQNHIDQMQNFLKNDVIDPKAPALSLVNQDLLYLKKGNSGSKKYVLSLHKFPALIFPDDDIEERTSRWLDKCVKKQKEPGKPIEEVYSNSKIVQVIKTTGELGHEHKFVTNIIVRRANGRFSSITEPHYKNLDKNDIEDMYLLCVNGKVDDYAKTGLLWSFYQHNVNLTAPTITFPGIEKKKMFFIITEPIHGIIYKNNKKETRVMGHHEIHKFCDATLKRVLEGLKNYNNDVKHGYATLSLSKEDTE
ncbi:hypothetical protein Tco_0612847, partial [Tanacetum coccineum]